MDTSVIVLLVISIITFLGRTVLAAFSQDINIVNSFAIHNTQGMVKHIILNGLLIVPIIVVIITLVKFVKMRNEINDKIDNLKKNNYNVPKLYNDYSIILILSIILLIVHLILSGIDLFPLIS
jgi:hypothetical protein